MSMIWRRYVKSTGYAPAWFYAALAVGFVVLAGWAIIAQDWLVAALALAMFVVAVAAVPVTRRLARGLAASEQEHRRT
jgi:hypothetical protein